MVSKKLDGEEINRHLDFSLKLYAQKNCSSRGREYESVADLKRTPFQRDRDRILHAKSFRRLAGKMQVVTPSYGDHFRNRLTHSLEVAQIARDLARSLGLNEDLTEAIALAHDLGHPPFGHTGEQALDLKMRTFGQRFDHNEQSLRVVTFFEKRYPEYPGLNLSFEVLEGMRKHDSDFVNVAGQKIFTPHLESQLVDLSDEIAYLSADLEDGIRGKFFDIEALGVLELVVRARQRIPKRMRNDIQSLVRSVIKLLLEQVIVDTEYNIRKFNIIDLASVQKNQERIVYFNKDFYLHFRTLKQFLFEHFYLKPSVKKIADSGSRIIGETFDFLIENPDKIPSDFFPETPLERRVCDYIAGMTDDYLRDFYEKNKSCVV